MLEALFVIIFGLALVWVVSRGSRLRLRMRLELFTLLLVILVAGGYAMAKRFEGGLGAVTNLSDQFPWGIWIGADLCGIALAAGGFVLAASVHVLHMRRFEPILRPTILTSFIAYAVVAAILVLDLGRPYRFWHPLILWQPHSVMFEITLCLSLYTVVLAMEFSPVVFERLRLERLAGAMRQLALPVVMLGVILSTLHQSSFGSLFLIVPQKLHPLWYTPLLPVLFFVSSMCAGLAVLIVESHVCAVLLKRRLPLELTAALGRGCGRLLWVYLILKTADLAWRGAWQSLMQPAWIGGAFALEVLVGIVAPAVWLRRISAQRPAGLVASAVLVIGGVTLNRLNVSWLGLLPFTGFVYAPSWLELALTGALILTGALAFVAAARVLPVFPEVEPSH